MYVLKDGIEFECKYLLNKEYTKQEIANFLGIANGSLSKIIHKKNGCKKCCALMLSYLFSGNFNIEEYFDYYSYEEYRKLVKEKKESR